MLEPKFQLSEAMSIKGLFWQRIQTGNLTREKNAQSKIEITEREGKEGRKKEIREYRSHLATNYILYGLS